MEGRFSSARAEISATAQNMKIAHEESQENQNGAKNTNRENRRIAFLAVWPFGDAQFPTFWDSISLQYDETEVKPFFGYVSQPERHNYIERKDLFRLVVHVHGRSDSLVLFNLVCIEVDVLIFHLSFEICETMNKILYFISFIILKSLLLST